MKRIYKSRKINYGTAIGFGMTDLLGGSAYAIVSAWLLFFFTQYTNITATKAASILVIAKFFDSFFSIFVGYLSDSLFKFKVGRRFGRRHLLMLIGIPLVLEYALIWMPNHNYWYYLITYILFELIVSLVLIPWETLPTEMTNNYKQRSLLSTIRLIISELATFLAMILPRQLLNLFGENNPTAFVVNSIIFSFIFSIAVFISWKTTWENPPTLSMPSSESMTFKKLVYEYIEVLKIKSFRQHLMIYLTSYGSMDIWNAVFVYFVTINLGLRASIAAGIQSINIVSIPMTGLLGYIIIKKGPKWIYHFSYALIIISSIGWLAVWLYMPNNIIYYLYFIGLVYYIGRSGMVYTPWNVFSFIPDIDEVLNGQKRAGMFTSIMTFIRKSTSSIGTFLVGFILDRSGYINKSTIQPHTVHVAISFILIGGVSFFIFLAWYVVRKFNLTFETSNKINQEIQRVKNGGNPNDVDQKVKNMIENLSGQPYPKS